LRSSECITCGAQSYTEWFAISTLLRGEKSTAWQLLRAPTEQPNSGDTKLQLSKSGVGVEKVTSIRRMRFREGCWKKASAQTLFDSDRRRPADHDGQHDRSETLFHYFRLEDQVPESHLLRLIDKHISFEFVRAQPKDSYSDWEL
jgi:hypothetical protein